MQGIMSGLEPIRMQDGGPLSVTDLSEKESQILENIFTKLYLSDYDTFKNRRSPDYSKITEEEYDFLQRYNRGKVARDMPLLSKYQERVGFYPGGKAFEESDGLPMKEFGASAGIAMLATLPKQVRKAFYGKEYMSNPIEDRIKAEARDIADQEYNKLMGRKDGGIVKLQEGGDVNLEKEKKNSYQELLENPTFKKIKTAIQFNPLTAPGSKNIIMDPMGAYEKLTDYIFDPTDPMDYLTLPLYAAGPLGGAANKALKARRVAKNIKKASKLETGVGSPLVRKGIPSALFGYAGTDAVIEAFDEADAYMKNPNMAYLDPDGSGAYYYYDPDSNGYKWFKNEVPEGYTLEQ